MKRKLITTLIMTALIFSTLAGCGSTSTSELTNDSQTQEETGVANVDAESEAKAVEEEAARIAEEEVAQKAAEEAAARETEANEYYEAGRAYLYGLDGTEINLETAHANFEKAVELGKNDANFYLGVLCDWYGYPRYDYEMAKCFYEKCEDNPYARINLGSLYLDGKGVEENKEKAKEIFETVIKQNCIEGYYGNAWVAYYEDDYDTAFEYCNKVLEKGTEQLFVAAAMNDIGFLYECGKGVEVDYKKALEWYEKASDLGCIIATYNIGCFYRDGAGAEPDYVKALEWYEKAADLGNASAMYEIAWLYTDGKGVEQDYKKASEWYEKAADLGDTSAMCQIAYLYENGKGVEQDYEEALEWYEKAAELGNSSAMNNIGALYYNGAGVEQSYEKALEWFEKAAELGDEVAMENAEAARQQLQ